MVCLEDATRTGYRGAPQLEETIVDALIESAKAEERKLVAQLQNDPTFQKLEAVRRLLETYGEATGRLAGDLFAQGSWRPVLSKPVSAPRPQTAPQVSNFNPKPNSNSARVASAAAAYLRKTGKRAQSLEIMQALEKEGFSFVGDKPTTGLASILSHNPLFDNVRGAGNGYGLMEWREPSGKMSEGDAPIEAVGSDRGGGESDQHHDNTEKSGRNDTNYAIQKEVSDPTR